MSTATLYLRYFAGDGRYRYARAVFTPQGRIRPHVAYANGGFIQCPSSPYYVRYRFEGKRFLEPAGTDPTLALTVLQRRRHTLEGIRLGLISHPTALPLAFATQASMPPPVNKIEPRVASQGVPPPQTNKRPLVSAMEEYLAEIKEHRSKRTSSAYSESMRLFQESCDKKFIEDIERKDMLAFISHLKARGNGQRTIRNRVDHFQTFLRRHGIESILKGRQKPQYTEKKVRAYSQSDLDKMFAVASIDEADLLHFLLTTGAREQEAQYACWSDVDLDGKTYTITEHLDLGFCPKDKEEGTVPLPDTLIERLKVRRVRYPKSRLLFPRADGSPDGHLLRTIKRLALRAGINCGFCINKRGQSCAKHPVCKHVILHKLRKTYATTLHRNGISARTIMRYLRHSDLDTTLKYLADEDDDNTREIVNKTFARYYDQTLRCRQSTFGTENISFHDLRLRLDE